MSNYQKGKQYENFVENVYKAILEAEKREGKLSPIKIERNIKLICKSGAAAEFDIFWEYKIASIPFKVVIECKNYNKIIDIGDIHEFANKIKSVGGLTGIMVSKKGFSENSKKEAKYADIQLLIIREQENKDWEGRLQIINMKITAISPSMTMHIEPIVNKAWAFENGYKSGDVFSFSGNNGQIFLEEPSLNFRYSLLELERNDFFSEKPTGIHTWKKTFNGDGWIICGTEKTKIDSISVTYNKPSNTTSEVAIDFSNYVLAIMEHIFENKKVALMKNGVIKEF